MQRTTSAKPFFIALALVVTLVLGGVGALAVKVGNAPPPTTSKTAAEKLVVQVLPRNLMVSDLSDRRELRNQGELVGYAWRISPKDDFAFSRSRPRSSTHLGILACVRGDRATDAVRFSYLKWAPDGCRGGEARLRRAERTPEEDAQINGAAVGRPSAADLSDTVQRASGRG